MVAQDVFGDKHRVFDRCLETMGASPNMASVKRLAVSANTSSTASRSAKSALDFLRRAFNLHLASPTGSVHGLSGSE